MATQYANGQIVTNGLVLSLDAADRNSYPGSGTTWRDMSGNANNGTLTNGPTFSSANGGSIVFDGTNDYVNIPNSSSIQLTTQMSLCAWIYLNSSSDSLVDIFYKATYASGSDNSGYILRVYNGYSGVNGSMQFILLNNLYTAVGTNTNEVLLNNWYYVCGTYNGSVMVVYINGVSKGTLNYSSNVRNNTEPLTISPSFSNFSSLGGNVTIAQIYNRGLSATEVLQNYDAHRNRFVSSVQGTINGLFGRKYSGYFNDSVSWFSTATITNTEQTTLIDKGSDGDFYSWMWLGYFRPSTTETYTFYTTSDDASYLWIGSNAQSGYTTGNALINNGGLHGAQERSGNISLTSGVYYPIRIMFGENGGGDSIKVEFSSPSVSRRTNGSGYYFDGGVNLFTEWP